MDAVLDYAERRTRACIAALPDGVREADDVLEAPEGDLLLRLKATVAGERLALDFTGSAAPRGQPQLPAGGDAVGVLVCGAGAHRPRHPALGGRLPSGRGDRAGGLAAERQATRRPTAPLPAVAAGNVETSSRVADLVLGAFGRALGQGTMNNLTLGNDGLRLLRDARRRPGRLRGSRTGPAAVHVAMSNTLNTPIEALERELPLLVTEYALRRGSGGAGTHRGGDGVMRELEALSDMTFSLIAERRRHAPPGAHGGGPGEPGRDTLIGRQSMAKPRGDCRRRSTGSASRR